ncbi:hypothetical protein N9878_00920 [bacterium]|nr:hypothetical protein [bacterium]
MAFESSNFIPLSAMANSNAGRMFSYRVGGDTLATVKGVSYFDEAGSPTGGMGLKSGDFILVDASDAQSILFVGVAPTTGVVTVASANDFA